jgi:hypothetical protein
MMQRPREQHAGLRLAQSKEGGWYDPDVEDQGQRNYDYDPMADGFAFVPSGNAARTRLAKATPGAVEAVEWTKRWGWKCVGCFVPGPALAEIEQRLTETADQRARQREQGRKYREKQEAVYQREFADTLRRMFPRMPARDVEAVTQHTTEVGAGTVGRTRLRGIEDRVMLATIAHIRHTYTNYDDLVPFGKHDARAAVRETIDGILARWQGDETIDPSGETGRDKR